MLLKVVGVILLALFVQFLINTILFFDVNKRIYNHRPGECRRVKGPEHGSEDIELISDKGIAFVTSGLVYFEDLKAAYKGRIFLYDLNQKGTYEAKNLPIVGLEDKEGFHPHGISHWRLRDGTIRLFVVVHSKQFKHSIVILDYDETKQQLKHVRTINDDSFVRPNDVAATGEDSFIVSNDGGAQTRLMNVVEMLTGIHRGSVVYFDGKKSHVILDGVAANGMFLTKDKTLFVSLINERAIGVYKWDQAKKSLTKISKVDTKTGQDNFFVDDKRNLWTGAHPVLKDAVGHLGNFSDPALHAPSQVLRVAFSADYKKWSITELLADDGRFVSGSSIAVQYSNQLLVGTVCRQLVHCDIGVPMDFSEPNDH